MTEIDWLRELETLLWSDEEKGIRFKLHAKRELSKDEWSRVCAAIAKHKLIVEMINTNMFGGVGIQLYEHPPVPGVDEAEYLLTLTQDHLPGPTRYDHLRGEIPEVEEHVPGSCRRDAWETFSALADTEQNRRWLKQYGLQPPRDAGYYDY